MKNLKTIITTDSGMDPIDTTYMAKGILEGEFSDGRRVSYEDNGTETVKRVLEDSKNGAVFKTAAPLITDYENIYTRALNEGEHVIHLSMSSGISSSSVNVSNMVANEINPSQISVIDSKSGATGGTLINLYAKHLIDQGLNYKEVLTKLKSFIGRVKTEFFVPNPMGYIRSGRNSLANLRIPKLFNDFKVIVTFKDGKLFPSALPFRSRCNTDSVINKWITKYINDETIEGYERDVAVIGTLQEENVEISRIIDYLKGYFKTVIREDINAVVAAYGSTDLVGLSLVRRNK